MGLISSIINKNKYEYIKELGKGGFGNVFQVLSKSENKYYALKKIPIKGEKNEQIINFQNEADILSKFNSNNIVKYYDSYQDNNNIYILMEFCDGENLRHLINKQKANNILIEENILIKIIKQICIGIKEIHNKKIIHRDLKPENIFMNENMDIKIGDFGLSKQFDSYKTHYNTTKKAGTDYYLPPEIIYKGIYSEKSDIWSLGCIIYELFNLSIYSKDKSYDEIKIINTDIYNSKWQVLIDSLLIADYKKRFDIIQVIKFLKEELNINISLKNKNKDNIIIGELYINKNDIKKNIQIVNSFENAKRIYGFPDEDDDFKYKNEKEIKENINIIINGIFIEFSYYYKFNKEGKYKIEYSFKNNLSKTCYMFYGCNSLTSLDLTNFKNQKSTNMRFMFGLCKSLTNLNLSNFNDMKFMFFSCKSLTNLNLSYFNTENVNYMEYMFFDCNSLSDLDLSNFNTKNVSDMRFMFGNCKSLTNLNLLNFDIQFTYFTDNMLDGCISLKKENIIYTDKKIFEKLSKNLQ